MLDLSRSSGARVDLLDAAAVEAAVQAASPEIVFHLAARAHVGRSWREPGVTLADNQAMTLNLLEAVRADGAGGGGRLRLQRRGLRPAGRAARRARTRRCARRTPTRSPRRRATSSRASTPTPTACASCAPVRSTTPGPGRRPATRWPPSPARSRPALEAGADPVRVVTGNPDARRDYTDVRDVVAAYRALAARARAGRLQRLLGPAGLGGRGRAGARARPAASRSSRRSTRRSCARTR